MDKKHILYTLIILFVLGTTFYALFVASEVKNLEDYQGRHIDNYEEILNVEIEGMEGGDYYLILFYGKGAESRYIEKDIALYFQRGEKIPLLFYNADEQVGDDVVFEGGFKLAGEDDYIIEDGRESFDYYLNYDIEVPSEIRLYGFPTIIAVYDGKIEFTYTSVEEIRWLLDEIHK